MEIRYSKATVELVKKLVLAWDPDFTKLTPGERVQVERAFVEMEVGDYVSDSAISWN